MATVPTRLAFALEGMPYRVEDDRRDDEPRDHVDHEKQREIVLLNTAPASEQCGNQCDRSSQKAEYQESVSLHRATSGMENDKDQRLATRGLSMQPDFIASPLHCVVRHGRHLRARLPRRGVACAMQNGEDIDS